MSKELYPANSTIVDLRSKISSSTTQTPSKTKLFVNELHRFTGASTPRDHANSSNMECERWFTPRPEDGQNTSLPPKRSMFTSSRLQNISAQRNRESRKPYWRCPQPTASRQTTETNIEQILRNEFGSTSSLANPAPKSIIQTPSITVTPAPMKSFVRRREPEIGMKTNVLNVADEELTLDQDDNNIIENELAKVKPPPLFGAPKAGFLTGEKTTTMADIQETIADDDLVFTFSDPISRVPKCLTPPPKEANTQTENTSTQLLGVGQLKTGLLNVDTTNNGTGKAANQPAGELISSFPTTSATSGCLFQLSASPLTNILKIPAASAPLNGPAAYTTTVTAAAAATSITAPAHAANSLVGNSIGSGYMLGNGINGINSPALATTSAPVLAPVTSIASLVGAAAMPQNDSGFKFGASLLNGGGGFQFGPPTATSNDQANGMNNNHMSAAPFAGFQFNNESSDASGAGFHFGTPPVNGSAFQFVGSNAPTATTDAGLTSGRSGVPVRKLLHPRRMKKR